MARPAARSKLTEAELGDWAAYAQQVRPLKGKSVPPLPAPHLTPAPTLIEPSPTRAARSTVRATRSAFLTVGDAPGGLDKASWNKFRTGKMATMRTLDLHGRTAQRAFHALQSFLHAAHADHVRCVEVITGRGAGEAGGVLRRELPLWLNLPALRPMVLAATHPHAANTGAVRIMLRRPK